VAASANVVLSGYFIGPATLDFAGVSIMGGEFNLFVVKLDPNGAYTWGKGFDNSGGSLLLKSAIAVDGMGRVFVAAEYQGTVDFGGGPLTGTRVIALASFDAGGNFRWAQPFGGWPDGDNVAIALDSSSHVLIAGGVTATVDFGCGPLANSGGEAAFVAGFMQ
jgi:hypothetical protein